MCPHCRQDAPVVYRGVVPYCTACGRQRLPLTGTALNLAGQPSKVTGALARIFGWLALACGLIVALLVGALFQAIFPAGIVGYLLGALLAAASIGVSLLLLHGGKSLHASGAASERHTREQALFALARHRGGMLTTLDVSQALGLPVSAADHFMTQLAKEDPERVRLEVDENGTLVYFFPQTATPSISASSPGPWSPPGAARGQRFEGFGPRLGTEDASREPIAADEGEPGTQSRPERFRR